MWHGSELRQCINGRAVKIMQKTIIKLIKCGELWQQSCVVYYIAKPTSKVDWTVTQN